jgi:hypothetical protein
LLGNAFLSSDDKLCYDEDLEREAEEMLQGKSKDELLELQDEVEANLAQDKSFAMDMQYW